MMNQHFADMESRGPQYTNAIKAICTLGRRSARKKLRSYPDVEEYIENHMREELKKTAKSEAPGSAIARIWETKEPFLPERVLSDDPIARGKLPTWAIDQLDWDVMKRYELNRDATMSQAPRTEYPHTTMRNSAFFSG